MRRVSSALLATAGFAALFAAPMLRAAAQGTPPSSNATITSESANCSDPKTGATFTSTLNSTCSVTGSIALPDPPGGTGVFTAFATADVLPGTSVHAYSEFDGDGGPNPVDVDATGRYFQYFTFGGGGAGNVVTIVFTSLISASTTSDDPSHAVPTLSAFLEFGLLNNDNSFQPTYNAFGYSSGTSLEGTVDVGSDLGGAQSFYFLMLVNTHVVVAIVDPFASSDITMYQPTVMFLDGNGDEVRDVTYSFDAPSLNPTATPEPATLSLMATGLVGIAGFARRKRRAAMTA